MTNDQAQFMELQPGRYERNLIDHTADIVAAYVGNNHVATADLPALLASVHAGLMAIIAGAGPAAATQAEVEKLTPAQIRKSITPDTLISFIDGKPYKTLKRHLTKHDLDPKSYRQRYGLPADYPMVAASYSETRSGLAKSLGLGQRRAAEPEPQPAETAKPKSRKAA